MRRPLVSVILDNYNYGRFISEAIDSVLNQTYKNYEIVIVDDGSSDNSVDIIKQYARQYSFIKPIFKENGGQTSAFNVGYENISGEIIAFLDSDDYWYPKKLEKIVEMHEKHDLVQHYLSYNGNGIYRIVHEDIDWHDILVKYGYLYNHSVCSSLSFHKSLLDKIFPLIDEAEMLYCTDGILLMAALSLTKIGICNEVLGFYRVHGSNLFVNCTDRGEKAKKILEAQHLYVNKQLRKSNLPEINFDKHNYFRHLIKECLKNGDLSLTSKCVLYGTEASGANMTDVLTEMNIFIYGYADSNQEKQKKMFLNKTVFSPSELFVKKDEFDKIIITSSAFHAISQTLLNEGFLETEYLVLPI